MIKSLATIAALMMTATALADNPSAAPSTVNMPTKKEALEAVKDVKPPAGVTFTGSAELVKQPDQKALTKHEAAQEQWWGGGIGGWGGWGGWGGYGGWGGWGGFGPYRFGFSCGGIPGWAYPLSYWNLWGAGLYGGGCGLGLAYGGLYYC